LFNLPQIAQRLYNTPLLLHPGKAEIICAALHKRIFGGSLNEEALLRDAKNEVEANEFFGSRKRPDGSYSFNPAESGIAVISITGSLVNRGAWIGSYSGLQSYEGIAAQLADARADPHTRGVILDIDSFGGEVGGIANLAASIRALRDEKPVYAVINDHAYSAGYWIASQASQIVVSPTSALGSIGVIWIHLDHSKELEAQGIDPTIITAGAKKADGNPFEPLSERARENAQEMVMGLYDRFTQAVEEGRGASRLTAKAARATEAGDFTGEEAIKAGLADAIGTFEGVFTELSSGVSAGWKKRKGATMATEDNLPPVIADHTKAIADAVAAERARYDGIVNSEAAKGKGKLANELARQGLSIEQATAILEAAASEASAIPPLAERADAGALADAHNVPAPTTQAAIDASWDKAVAKVNKQRGFKAA